MLPLPLAHTPHITHIRKNLRVHTSLAHAHIHTHEIIHHVCASVVITLGSSPVFCTLLCFAFRPTEKRDAHKSCVRVIETFIIPSENYALHYRARVAPDDICHNHKICRIQSGWRSFSGLIINETAHLRFERTHTITLATSLVACDIKSTHVPHTHRHNIWSRARCQTTGTQIASLSFTGCPTTAAGKMVRVSARSCFMLCQWCRHYPVNCPRSALNVVVLSVGWTQTH